VPLKRSAGAAD